jgi:hypothetical protein
MNTVEIIEKLAGRPAHRYTDGATATRTSLKQGEK